MRLLFFHACRKRDRRGQQTIPCLHLFMRTGIGSKHPFHDSLQSQILPRAYPLHPVEKVSSTSFLESAFETNNKKGEQK
jgi:hypothetical protein